MFCYESTVCIKARPEGEVETVFWNGGLGSGARPDLGFASVPLKPRSVMIASRLRHENQTISGQGNCSSYVQSEMAFSVSYLSATAATSIQRSPVFLFVSPCFVSIAITLSRIAHRVLSFFPMIPR